MNLCKFIDVSKCTGAVTVREILFGTSRDKFETFPGEQSFRTIICLHIMPIKIFGNKRLLFLFNDFQK